MVEIIIGLNVSIRKVCLYPYMAEIVISINLCIQIEFFYTYNYGVKSSLNLCFRTEFLFDLWFNIQVNTAMVMSRRSVNLNTFFVGKLRLSI